MRAMAAVGAVLLVLVPGGLAAKEPGSLEEALAGLERMIAEPGCDTGELVCAMGRVSMATSIARMVKTMPCPDGDAACAKARDERAAAPQARAEGMAAALRERFGPVTVEDRIKAGTLTETPDIGQLTRLVDSWLEAVRGASCPAENPVCTAGRLAILFEPDQAIRRLEPCVGLKDDAAKACEAEHMALYDRVDKQTSAPFMADLMDRAGWPDAWRFGDRADRNAWLLVQHADHDRPLQRRALALLEPAALAGRSSPINVAYLEDRVAVGEGRPQRFGTQGRCEGPVWVARTLVDPARLDEFRKAYGLPPHAEYQARINMLCARQPQQ